MIYILAFLVVILSVAVGILVWYIRGLLEYTKNVNEDVFIASSLIKDFKDHLDKVYNAERFYGDSTLEGLVVHIKDLMEELEIFIKQQNIFLDSDNNEKEEEKE